MKKFAFPLSRVLDWRRTQLQIEETTLERFYVELRALETRLREARLEREESGRWLLAGGSVTGAELAALDRFKTASMMECARLAGSAAATRPRIAAQLQIVIQKRRDVKLLELLRARKLATWNLDLDRDIDREAAELHLAKFKRAGQISPYGQSCKIDHGS
jgi:flagellar export protein FliJ